MKKAVIVFSGGIDSVCSVSFLKSKYELYGITFSYGQKASREITSAKSFAKKLGLKQHKIIDIGFMKEVFLVCENRRKTAEWCLQYGIYVIVA